MEPRTFLLFDGGPFHALMRRLGFVRPSGMLQWHWLVALTWGPTMAGELVRLLLGLPMDPTWLDISVHARLLVTLPIMLVAERIVESAVASAVRSLYEGAFCDPAELDPIVASGERLRDARWIEAVLAVLAIAGGQASLWRVTGATGLFHGGAVISTLSFPRLWYLGVALPVVQFIMIRWLWRWLIWSYMLLRVAKLPLNAIATHPDRAAGLSCVSRGLTGFGIFTGGITAIIAGAWETQVLANRTSPRELMPLLLTYLLILLVVAAAPQLAFSGHLFRARRRSIAEYGDFTEHYVRSFHAKWIESHATGGEALGSSDIQSLADIGNAYGAIERTRWFTFGPRRVIEIWLPALLPMLPLFAGSLSVEKVLGKILRTIFAGLPI